MHNVQDLCWTDAFTSCMFACVMFFYVAKSSIISTLLVVYFCVLPSSRNEFKISSMKTIFLFFLRESPICYIMLFIWCCDFNQCISEHQNRARGYPVLCQLYRFVRCYNCKKTEYVVSISLYLCIHIKTLQYIMLFKICLHQMIKMSTNKN